MLFPDTLFSKKIIDKMINFQINIWKHQVLWHLYVSIQNNMSKAFSIFYGQLINKQEGTDNMNQEAQI